MKIYIWMSIINAMPRLTYWYRNSSYEHSNYTLTRENTWKKTILSKGRFWRIVNNSNSLAFSSCYQFKLYFEQTCQISQNFLFLISSLSGNSLRTNISKTSSFVYTKLIPRIQCFLTCSRCQAERIASNVIKYHRLTFILQKFN